MCRNYPYMDNRYHSYAHGSHGAYAYGNGYTIGYIGWGWGNPHIIYSWGYPYWPTYNSWGHPWGYKSWSHQGYGHGWHGRSNLWKRIF